MRRVAWGGVALLATTLLASCSSSGGSPPSSSPAPSSPSTSSSPPPSSSTPPTSSAPAPPLSPFEADPAVKALRAWADQVAKTINTGQVDDAALNLLMTPALAGTMKNLAGGEIGHRYPGPLPFTPTQVVVASSTVRNVRLCMIDNGFSLNPKTNQPYAKYHVQAVAAGAQLVGGRWLVAKFDTGSFSCAGVKIAERRW